MKHYYFLSGVLFLMLFSTLMVGQSAHVDLREGDAHYHVQEFDEAEKSYRDAAVKELSSQSKFNLGNSLYNQGRYQEAAEEFQQAVNLSTDTVFRAKALYNKGNSLLQEGKYQESLEAYKKSLLLNPNDEDAKRNFMFALKNQQQQEQEQKESENKEDNENEDSSDENEPQSPQQNEQQQDKEEEQQQKEEQQEQKEDEESQPRPEDQEMSREEAEQLLEIIENTDDFVQKKLKKQNSTKKQTSKNW